MYWMRVTTGTTPSMPNENKELVTMVDRIERAGIVFY
jgi:hypothetical protein